MSSNTQYDHVLVSRPISHVGLVTLNRPTALNAIIVPLILDLNAAFKALDDDDDVRAIILTGGAKTFCVGADLSEMKNKDFSDMYKHSFLEHWADMMNIGKPILAAVNGFALGGGCELALMCDIVLASPSAVFAQAEIHYGIIPGGGGTQRLARAVGKSRAMELTLTGRKFNATEAAGWGIVSSVHDNVIAAAIQLAAVIANKPAVAVRAGKEAVNAAYEGNLAEGLKTERRLFNSLFATKDQKEGVRAFMEKRKARWSHL